MSEIDVTNKKTKPSMWFPDGDLDFDHVQTLCNLQAMETKNLKLEIELAEVKRDRDYWKGCVEYDLQTTRHDKINVFSYQS